MLTHGKDHAGLRKERLPKATAINRMGLCRQYMEGEPFPSGIQSTEVGGFWQSHLSWLPLINGLIYFFSNHLNVCCELIWANFYTCLPGPQQMKLCEVISEGKSSCVVKWKVSGTHVLSPPFHIETALTPSIHRGSRMHSLTRSAPRRSACAGLHP